MVMNNFDKNCKGIVGFDFPGSKLVEKMINLNFEKLNGKNDIEVKDK